MLTNVLQFLETTVAYQTAALQLMVGEANFAATQLHLDETIPSITLADTNQWRVDPPFRGVSGIVTSSNYQFFFTEGKLYSIRRSGFGEVEVPISSQETNRAYQLARQKLAALSVDMDELERRFPGEFFPDLSRLLSSDSTSLSDSELRPLFKIGWGLGANPFPASALNRLAPPCPAVVHIEFHGRHRHLLALDIRDSSFLKRSVLQLTNAAELLGPAPPTRPWVEQLFGGPEAWQTIASPDTVEAWLLSDITAIRFRQDYRVGPVKLEPGAVKTFSGILLNFDSYFWRAVKSSLPTYVARVRFVRGNDSVEVWLDYRNDVLETIHNGRRRWESTDRAHDALVKALQSVFPEDKAVKELKLQNE